MGDKLIKGAVVAAATAAIANPMGAAVAVGIGVGTLAITAGTLVYKVVDEDKKVNNLKREMNQKELENIKIKEKYYNMLKANK